MKLLQFLRRVYRSLPAPPSTNYNLDQIALDPYNFLAEDSLVLDIGSSSARGRYAFVGDASNQQKVRLIGLDIEYADGVSLIADAHHIPLQPNSVDCVLCVSVLEYVRYPQQVIAEINRVLKPGGFLYLNAPFVFPYHPPPEDLYRFSPSGIRVLAERFEEIRVGYNRGPASTFCHLFVHFLAILLCFNSRPLYGVLVDLFKWLFFWVKYLDRWIGNYEVANVLSGSSFFFGRKTVVR